MVYRFPLIVIVVLFLSGCAVKFPIANNPVNVVAKNIHDEIQLVSASTRSDDLLLILTFSGGGTRAAALSYGVLKELRDTTYNGTASLLSEVDVISSVSGGSFTAAYYGLYGDKIFLDYERKVLKKSIQSKLVDMFLNPLNWINLSNRGDMAARFYASDIFEHKTFKDLRDDGPRIVINATDISAGTAFSFTPGNFYRICSDLDSYPISKAVTASSAVPVVFSPLTLKNYDGCYGLAGRSEQIHRHATEKNYKDKHALRMHRYQDKKRYPYLHLVDGGIADNLGIRALLEVVSEYDNNFIRAAKAFGVSNVKKVALIIVNAADGLPPRIAQEEEAPDAATTMGAVSTIQLRRYNSDTLDLVNTLFKRWKQELKETQCSVWHPGPCDEIDFYMVELEFNQLPEEQAAFFSTVETSLELPADTVDALIDAGGYLLKNSPRFQTLIQDLERSHARKGH